MALIPRDLSAFTAGTDEQRRTFAAELLDDYQRCGFAKIVNHGITEDEVRQLFEWVCGLSECGFDPTTEVDLEQAVLWLVGGCKAGHCPPARAKPAARMVAHWSRELIEALC